jgi:D-tyrosyl-tRNA(Tyr) deacylase
MRVVVQRVSTARVRVDLATVGSIGPGLLLLVGAGEGDSADAARWLADKCAHLRIFEDDDRRMNRSLVDIGGAALVVSQFTLYGDCRKGRRPSFTGALAPEAARALVELFASCLRAEGIHVETGEFGAKMEVELINQGPVTLLLEYP